MTDFITTFKAKAKSKNLTAADMIALCIYKTVKAKSEDKVSVLKYYLTKAFTAGKVCAHRQYPYQAITLWTPIYEPRRSWDGEKYVMVHRNILGVPMDKLLSDSEINQMREVLDLINLSFVRNL